MMKLWQKVIFSFLSAIPTGVYAGSACDLTAQSGETVPIAVPHGTSGATVTLPFVVRDIVGSKHFEIKPVGSERDQFGQAKNPKSFLITALKSGVSDEITLFLGSSQNDRGTINLALSATNKSRRTTTICMPNTKKQMNSKANYISREMNMMVSMIRDDALYGRQVVSNRINIKGVSDKVSVKVVRVFRLDDLTGYTFLFTNKTSKSLKLNLSSLAFGTPNRAVALHADHEVLEPCSRNRSTHSKENGCSTFVRLLVSGNLKPEYLTLADESFPFTTMQEKALN